MKLSRIILFLLVGAGINIALYLVLFIAAYMNPATYRGREGYSSGLIVLIIAALVWLTIIIFNTRKKNKEALIGYILSALYILIFLILVTISDYEYLH